MQTSSYVPPFLSGYEMRQTALAGSSAVPFDMFSETQRHPRQKSKAAPSRAGKETAAVSGRMMVYEYIRQQMREGSLLPGSVLDLPAISHKLGISNTPLRDSLIRLEAEGYLTIYPQYPGGGRFPFPLRDHGGLGVHHHRRVHRPVHRGHHSQDAPSEWGHEGSGHERRHGYL